MLVIVHYRAFQDNFDVRFHIPDCFASDLSLGERVEYIAELIFKDTNLYSGPFWNRMDFPEDRHHTALSVGDSVTALGITVGCSPAGWKELV